MSEIRSNPQEILNIADLTIARIGVGRYERGRTLHDDDRYSIERVQRKVSLATNMLLYLETEKRSHFQLPHTNEVDVIDRILRAAGSDERIVASHDLVVIEDALQIIIETGQLDTKTEERMPTDYLNSFLENWELLEHQRIGSHGCETS